MSFPFVVAIDTREQKPWSFGPRAATERVGLATGDYSVVGLEDDVAIERKSIADLVGSLTQGRDRFFREMDRLRAFEMKAVIVEGTVRDIQEHRYVSRVSPSAVLGSALTIPTDYGIPLWWGGTREWSARAAYWILRRAADRHFSKLLQLRREAKAG